MPKGKPTQRVKDAQSYKHPESNSPLRPDVGTQPRFPKSKRKAPKTYRYDSSLSPMLDWDNNPTREQAEALIAEILASGSLDAAKAAAAKLKTLSQPFLNWAGKAEQLSFDVPTLPLFVHERLSTQAIIETLKGHKKGGDQLGLDLWGDPQHPITDQVLKAYEHRDKWVNRMILGDSLVVMNSLLEYEGLGGQVQMIYIDPPYGVKFGSNFQPFVRKRDVKHNEDEDMTREPEMVKAYRDTWDMGLHSYLSYLRDRLVLARELLKPSGSVFVQISDENAHHIRELMDEVFGANNFVSQINFQTTSGFETSTIATLGDFLLWYAKDKENPNFKVQKVFQKQQTILGEGNARWILFPDGSYRGITAAEKRGEAPIPEDAKLYSPGDITSQGSANEPQPFKFEGKTFTPGSNAHWKANYPEGMNRLATAGRIHIAKNSIRYRRFADDFPYQEIGNIWTDTLTGSFTDEKIYVVQTSLKVIERCLLMTTKPGDLVLDPTCGSGTTAYVSEQWGRRWITCDVSRVPLALARQRLLTATFSYYQLKDESRGPIGGFDYKSEGESRNPKNIGFGIVPHITLKSIANNEPPKEETLFDRPEVLQDITRVTGAFTVEATIPIPVDLDESEQNGNGNGYETSYSNNEASFTDRFLEVLRKSPVLRLEGNRTITFKSIRKPTKSLSLSAEALIDEQPVALVFGSENAAVVEHLVYQAALEARAKQYTHLYVIGFAIHPNARKLIDNCDAVMSIPATYVQATPDLLMGDLLKNMKSSQIFSVCGLPDISIQRVDDKYRVALVGLDVFDPVSMEPYHRRGDDVPAWFLDTDYNGLCFHVCQAFFPKTQAWDNLKKSLRKTYEESLWGHLAGTLSAPFEPGEHRQIAVKVIDERGNELLVVKSLS